MAGNEPVISMTQLLRWNDQTATRWARLLEQHPEALDFACDIYGSADVRGVVRHIVAVELRYSERLGGRPVTPYEQIPSGSAQELFAVHTKNVETFRALIADPAVDWEEKLEFNTKSAGAYQATRRQIIAHSLLHGIRHYAQLATLMRQHGIKPDWQMDFLFSDVMD